jgi:formamidopyrimidine-DNA glycosylase
MHLGMSGSFETHRGAAPALGAHDHVVFHMSSGATVVFNDPRRFGSMWLVDDASPKGDPLAPLGPEPLEDAFVAEVLAEQLRGRKAPLKTVLGDQRVVAGLGNIYVSEALHRARLSPFRASSTLVTTTGAPAASLRTLVRAIRDTLNAALTDDDNYDRLRVYGREGLPCLRRGCGGEITRVVQAGRSTFFCPRCQR